MTALWVVWFLILAMAVLMLVRNRQVYRYRSDLLDKVSNEAKRDIINGHYDFEWRYDEFRRVDYNQQMLQFWKRLDSFYPDKSFTNPKEVQ